VLARSAGKHIALSLSKFLPFEYKTIYLILDEEAIDFKEVAVDQKKGF
jgi:hypothetical protein